jgi:hypothetical protein
MNIRHLVFLFVFLICLPQTANAQSAEVTLLNLRIVREPAAPFRFHEGSLVAISTATPPSAFGNGLRSRWSVTVEIRGMPADTAVQARDNTLEVDSVYTADGSLIVTTEVEAPRYCRIRDQLRTFATIELVVEAGSLVVPIDHACLLGDLVSGTDASETLLDLARAPSWSLDEMTETVRPRMAFADVETLLVDELRVRRSTYRPDPMVQRGTPADAFSYVLRPEETLRYGGDCEDWSIVVAGFLLRAGVQTSIEIQPSHAFAAARSGGNFIPLDLVQVSLPILAGALRFDS